jgi:hypothetical protein
MLGFGYLIQTTQTRAIGASSIDEGDKIYLSSSSPAGEKPQSTFFLENSKDKVLLKQPVLIIPPCETRKVCRCSDFLTITRTRIYKSQNDP